MAHMPRRERIAQIVAILVDSPRPLTAYAIARRAGMSVSAHLRGLLNTACEMELIAHDYVDMPNGKVARTYYADMMYILDNADTEMLNMIYQRSRHDAWFETDEIPI